MFSRKDISNENDLELKPLYLAPIILEKLN